MRIVFNKFAPCYLHLKMSLVFVTSLMQKRTLHFPKLSSSWKLEQLKPVLACAGETRSVHRKLLSSAIVATNIQDHCVPRTKLKFDPK